MGAPGPGHPLLLAGAASAGAGIVHVAAAGAEHDRAAGALVLLGLGLAQLGWGAWAATRPPTRAAALAGLAVGLVALGGWAVAVTVGLPVPEALAEPLEPAVPDTLAALLAATSLAGIGRRLLVARGAGEGPPAGRVATIAPVAVAVVALAAVVAVPGAHDARQQAERDAAAESAAGAAAEEAADAARDQAAEGQVAAVAPFAPDRPLDLSGLPTVSAEEQEAAEDLVRAVLAAAPGYPSAASAAASGYRSIGDDFTGEEHHIDWGAVLDPATLDPAHPEALVFDVADDGTRTLAAVMFVLPPGTRLGDAPRPGGDLTTWHLHGELCIDPATEPPTAAGTTDATGACPAGLVEPQPSPTLHVWVTPHPCGPFSELEGVGTDPAAVAGGCEHRHG